MRESLEVLQLLVMRKKPLEMVPNSLLDRWAAENHSAT